MHYSIIIKEEYKRKRPIKSEVDKLLGCNKKAKKYLKWAPKYSGSKNFIKALMFKPAAMKNLEEA